MQWLSLSLLGLAYGVISALPMGPVGVLIFRNTLRGRRLAALYLIVGQTGAIATYVTLVTVGLEGLLLDRPALFHTIALVGALLVLGLGAMTLRAARRGASQHVVAEAAVAPPAGGAATPRARQLVLTGFSLALTNPGILFLLLTAVAVHASLLGSQPRGARLAVYLYSILAGIEGWFLLVVAFLPRLFRRPNVRQRLLGYLEWSAGVLLGAFGLFLLVREGRTLLGLLG